MLIGSFLHSLLSPPAIASIHPLMQSLLLSIFVIVLLDSSCTIADHFSNVGWSTRIMFAVKKCASNRVPRHSFIDFQNLANLIQCFADED